jgi:hypothetical protein
MSGSKVNLELSRNEALVFFAWDIEAMLESMLVEPLDRNYSDLLARAREAVRDRDQ